MEKGTLAKEGVAVVGIKGYARFALTKTWCAAYAFPKEKNYMFSAHGREGSMRLSHEFVRRANHYFDIFATSESEHYHFTDADRVEELADFTAWILTLDRVSRSFQSANELTLMFPINPLM